jgi:hypothetical protein
MCRTSNLEKKSAYRTPRLLPAFGFQKTSQRTSEGDIVAILRLNGTAERLESDESA